MGTTKFIPTSFYLDPTQKQWVKAKATAAKLSLSEYIRRKVLDDDYPVNDYQGICTHETAA